MNRHKPVHTWTDVLNVPFEGAPRLPKRCNGRTWPARTRQKWKAWSTMPHCVLWRPSDWEFAFDSLELAAYVHEGRASLATELRNREKVMAITADDRRSQRIRYVDPEPGAAADVVDMAGYLNVADYRDL